MACTSMSAEIRREKLPEVMRHYFNSLKKKLGKEPPFTFDNLMKSYHRGFKAGFLMGFGMLALVFAQNPELCGGLQYKEELIHRAQCLLDDVIATF